MQCSDHHPQVFTLHSLVDWEVLGYHHCSVKRGPQTEEKQLIPYFFPSLASPFQFCDAAWCRQKAHFTQIPEMNSQVSSSSRKTFLILCNPLCQLVSTFALVADWEHGDMGYGSEVLWSGHGHGPDQRLFWVSIGSESVGWSRRVAELVPGRHRLGCHADQSTTGYK